MARKEKAVAATTGPTFNHARTYARTPSAARTRTPDTISTDEGRKRGTRDDEAQAPLAAAHCRLSPFSGRRPRPPSLGCLWLPATPRRTSTPIVLAPVVMLDSNARFAAATSPTKTSALVCLRLPALFDVTSSSGSSGDNRSSQCFARSSLVVASRVCRRRWSLLASSVSSLLAASSSPSPSASF